MAEIITGLTGVAVGAILGFGFQFYEGVLTRRRGRRVSALVLDAHLRSVDELLGAMIEHESWEVDPGVFCRATAAWDEQQLAFAQGASVSDFRAVSLAFSRVAMLNSLRDFALHHGVRLRNDPSVVGPVNSAHRAVRDARDVVGQVIDVNATRRSGEPRDGATPAHTG